MCRSGVTELNRNKRMKHVFVSTAPSMLPFAFEEGPQTGDEATNTDEKGWRAY